MKGDRRRPNWTDEWTGEHVAVRAHEVRRRLDMSLLRWQAQLEPPAVDRSLPWVAAFVLFGALSLLALAKNRDLGLGPVQLHDAHVLAVVGGVRERDLVPAERQPRRLEQGSDHNERADRGDRSPQGAHG